MKTELYLNPPLPHVPIGTERKIVLYAGQSGQEQMAALFDDSMTPLFMNSIGHTDTAAVGYYNTYYGFFIAAGSPDGPVYSFDILLSPDKLIQVADTLSGFYEIILRIKKAWEPYQDKAYMPQNPRTKNVRDDVLRACKKIAPGSDCTFWEVLAFGELAIGLE